MNANPNLARVHAEGELSGANANELEGENGRQEEEPEAPGLWAGRVVQQLSGVCASRAKREHQPCVLIAVANSN